MSTPPIFSLSNELLIEIISNLCPNGIFACRGVCRQLNDLIVNSQLIQYIIRTALEGVYDPLDPSLSLPERLVALEQWETAWQEIDLRESHSRIDVPFPKGCRRQQVEFSFGRYFVVISEGYGREASYSFLDMHATFSSQHTEVARWTTIKIPTPNVLVFAFASELDLAVTISAPKDPDRRSTTLKICPMWFSTGKPHPLASRPTLDIHVPGASAYIVSDTEVIGDYILYWVGDPMANPRNEATLCTIYLVAWKEGWVKELRSTRPGVYGSVLSVLSEEIVMLIRLREPALELCRLSNLGTPDVALETLCIFTLPELTMNASLRWATCFCEHPGHALFSRGQHPPEYAPWLSATSTRQIPEGRRARRYLRSVAADGIISVVMHIHSLSGYTKTIDLSVRCRTLLAFPAKKTQAQAVAAASVHAEEENVEVGESESEDEDEREGERRAGLTGGGVLTVPWREWGPANTRVLEHDSYSWGSLVGERRATVGQLSPTRITVRDFNPFRVRRALKRTGGPEKELRLECGSVMKVIKETSSYRGGEWFSDDIESSLPYVETVTPYPDCEGIFMDEDNLLAEVHTKAGERKFLLHCL